MVPSLILPTQMFDQLVEHLLNLSLSMKQNIEASEAVFKGRLEADIPLHSLVTVETQFRPVDLGPDAPWSSVEKSRFVGRVMGLSGATLSEPSRRLGFSVLPEDGETRAHRQSTGQVQANGETVTHTYTNIGTLHVAEYRWGDIVDGVPMDVRRVVEPHGVDSTVMEFTIDLPVQVEKKIGASLLAESSQLTLFDEELNVTAEALPIALEIPDSMPLQSDSLVAA